MQVNVCARERLPNRGYMLTRKFLPPQPPLRLLLQLAPERVLAPLLAGLFTHLLRGQPLTARLALLAGKRVSLLMTDLPCELRFRITPVGLANGWEARANPPWDVRIRGTFDDFWRMATRVEDPDTLFFNRRLAIEGDTETGLAIKNLLDALEYDWPAHLRAVFGPLAAIWPQRRGTTDGPRRSRADH